MNITILLAHYLISTRNFFLIINCQICDFNATLQISCPAEITITTILLLSL